MVLSRRGTNRNMRNRSGATNWNREYKYMRNRSGATNWNREYKYMRNRSGATNWNREYKECYQRKDYVTIKFGIWEQK